MSWSACWDPIIRTPASLLINDELSRTGRGTRPRGGDRKSVEAKPGADIFPLRCFGWLYRRWYRKHVGEEVPNKKTEAEKIKRRRGDCIPRQCCHLDEGENGGNPCNYDITATEQWSTCIETELQHGRPWLFCAHKHLHATACNSDKLVIDSRHSLSVAACRAVSPHINPQF